MLLETLHNETDSVIVYSRNNFERDNNFSMILKNDPEKKPQKLFLYDICGLINNRFPKNLIAYRMLTNNQELVVSESQFGCMVRIGENVELIYPDPIYAVKELEAINEELDLPDLKFRIQQIGLTTSVIGEDEHIFREVFQFDLDSLEAEAQNDTVCIEALLHADKKTAQPKNITDAFGVIVTEELNDELSGREDADQLFHSLAGIRIGNEATSVDEVQPKQGKSVVDMFKFIPLKNQFKEKGKRIILKFRKKL
jgi:hypothetical protein